MKKYLTPVIGLLLLIIPIYFITTNQNEQSNLIYQIIVMILLPFMIFNLVARNFTWFKPYFTSPFNILTQVKTESFTYDLSYDLMFHKIVESVKNTPLMLASSDIQTGLIFAKSSMSTTSWGENIYITLEKNENQVNITLEFTTIAQISSWGKHSKHYRNILVQFEKSLVI
jgi:hypothetical protein